MSSAFEISATMAMAASPSPPTTCSSSSAVRPRAATRAALADEQLRSGLADSRTCTRDQRHPSFDLHDLLRDKSLASVIHPPGELQLREDAVVSSP